MECSNCKCKIEDFKKEHKRWYLENNILKEYIWCRKCFLLFAELMFKENNIKIAID